MNAAGLAASLRTTGIDSSCRVSPFPRHECTSFRISASNPASGFRRTFSVEPCPFPTGNAQDRTGNASISVASSQHSTEMRDIHHKSAAFQHQHRTFVAYPHHFHPHLAGWNGNLRSWSEEQARLICGTRASSGKRRAVSTGMPASSAEHESQRGNGTGWRTDAVSTAPAQDAMQDMRCVCKRHAAPCSLSTGTSFRQRMRCVCKRAQA